jgi:hypothetical protein
MKKDSATMRRTVLFRLRHLKGNCGKQFLLCLYGNVGDGICAVQKDCFLERIQVRSAVLAFVDVGLDFSTFQRIQISVQIIANVSVDGFAICSMSTAMRFFHIIVSYNH